MAEPDNQTPPNLPKGEAFEKTRTLLSPSFGGVGEVSVEEGKPGYVTANPGNYIFIKEVRDILKENPTKAEELIWKYLRNKKTGHKIRRQHIISDFITDFVCLGKKVVIEIDGDIHLQQLDRDEMRTRILNDLGYKVVRFTNEEVFTNVELVVKTIKDILDEPDNQTPPNLPEGEAFRGSGTLDSPSFGGVGEVQKVGEVLKAGEVLQTYISILRGINVGGHKMLKMDDLKKVYNDLDFSNIQTYIRSGNVVFQCESADCQELERKIANRILEIFSFEVPIIVIGIEALQKIVENNPFLADKSKDESFLHITFLSADPDPGNVAKLIDVQHPDEQYVLTGTSVYLYCPKGYGNAKLNNNFFESKFKVGATTRNWNTTKELLNIAGKLG